MPQLAPKSRIFWPLALAFLCADCATKRAAVELLSPAYISHDVLGDVVRFTLAYNRGAAMSIPVGDGARPLLVVATMIALALIASLYRSAAPHDRAIAAASALLVGGALGNLLDRMMSTRGVVDFIDVGVGTHRFWIFNVADVGVTVGTAALALVLSRRQSPAARPPAADA